MKAVILNDTRISRHLGCEIVMRQLLKYSRERGIRVIDSLSVGRSFEADAGKYLGKVDMYIINGEGTMHGDSRRALRILTFARKARAMGSRTVLLNSLWFGNHELNDYLGDIDLIACRESRSAREIRAQGFECLVVPDITLTFEIDVDLVESEADRGSSAIVLDNQRWENWINLGVYARQVGLPFYVMDSHRSLATIEGWRRILEERFNRISKRKFAAKSLSSLLQAPYVVSGRFHGCCLSILAQKPFVWFEGKTHKTRGLIEDANLGGLAMQGEEYADQASFSGHLSIKIQNLKEKIEDRDEMLRYRMRCREFIRDARSKTEMLFDRISCL